MKKIFLLLGILSTLLFAEYKSEYPTKEFFHSGIPVVDIRTPGEWKETGILKGAIPIMFFDERGGYNIPRFLKKLNEKVDTKKPFALICHTGSRTSVVAPWLAKQLGYDIINLRGGMEYVTRGLKIKTVPYKAE